MSSDQHESRFQEALALRDSGDLRGARDLLTELSKLRSDSAALFAVLGKLNWDLGDFDSAINAFEHATRLAPQSEAASLGLFHCLWESKHVSAAIDEIRRFQSAAHSQDYDAIVDNLRSNGIWSSNENEKI
jgi:predicted Zn-dependent protease